MFWQDRRRRVAGKTSSDIHAAITRECAFRGSVVARRELPVSMFMSAHETAQLHRKSVEFNTFISRLGDTRSEVLRDGSIDISAIHCPHARCKSDLFVCTISWVVSRICECTMSVRSRTVNALWNKRLSIVLHKCRYPSWILSFGIQLCLRLAESSAQSSSQSGR